MDHHDVKESPLDFDSELELTKINIKIINRKTMRSLFTEDIPGAKPKHQYYDKALYFKKHIEEVSRHGRKNPEEKRVFEWYTPK